MTKKDIAQAVAARTDVSAAAAEEIIGAALDVIGEQLAKGEDVRLAGFGTFETRDRAARTGRNPRPARRSPSRRRPRSASRLRRPAQARGERLTPTPSSAGARPTGSARGVDHCRRPVAVPRGFSRSQRHFVESGRIRP